MSPIFVSWSCNAFTSYSTVTQQNYIVMHRKVNNMANGISTYSDRNKLKITLHNHSHCRWCSSTGSVKKSNSPATQLSDTVNWACDVRLMCWKTNIKVLRIPQANIYITIKTVQDIPNGVDILLKPPCKFQPFKMANRDPWSPTTLLTEYFECTLNYLFIFFS